MFKKGVSPRRLLTLAVFGVVWFYRDYKATAFDEQEREAQEVLSKEQDHKQRQKQESDQREMMGLLARIDSNNGKATGPSLLRRSLRNKLGCGAKMPRQMATPWPTTSRSSLAFSSASRCRASNGSS